MQLLGIGGEAGLLSRKALHPSYSTAVQSQDPISVTKNARGMPMSAALSGFV